MGTNGALRLSQVLKKSSFATWEDTTKTQPKLKSINSMLFSENKLRSGLVYRKDKLYGQVEVIYQRIKSRIAQWKLCSEQMVYKVKANWEACLASRKSKLSVFTTCLYGK